MKTSPFRTILTLLIFTVLAACSTETPTGTDPAPGVTAPSEASAPPQSPVPGATLEATAPPAATIPSGPPPPTFTPLPTTVPAPFQGESILGIELIGGNFGERAGLASEAGAFWIRWNAIPWPDVEPNEGDRIWQALGTFDAQLQTLDLYDLKLITIVHGAPLWAQAEPGIQCGAVAEEKLAAFGNFMYDLVARYSQPPYNLKYWEIINEPDIDPSLVPPRNFYGCWGDLDDPFYGGGAYAQMLQAVYPRIKEADPEAQVLVGGLLLDCDPNNPPETAPGSGVPKYCDPAKFLEGILINGGGDYFDGVSFHAYDLYEPVSGYFGNPNWDNGHTLSGLIPVVVPKARFLKGVLAEYGYFNKYLINSETALLCGTDGNEAFCRTGQFERMKADYVAMTNAGALAEGLQGNIWFYLNGGWRRSGLTNNNGVPLDAFIAYQFSAKRLAGAVFWGQITEYEGVYGYKFRQGDKETWIMWSLDSLPHLVSVTSMPQAIYNVFGVPLNPTQSLEITTSPIYVDWQP